MQQPYYRAMQYTEMILTDIAWSPSEIIKSIQGKYIPTLFYKFELLNNL
jgi:hypothetical protein